MKSFPFDSLALYQDEKTGLWIGDRQGSAQDVRDINKIFWKNGVCLALENAFQITPGEGMNVIVAPGVCGIEGTLGIEPNERGLSLQASSSEDRIDTIVLRLNLNVEVRKIDLYVKTGVAQSVPVRPELTRSESVWELGIADIFVAKNSGAVSAARITDTRLQNERCGMMTPLMEVDTTSFYNQLQAALDEGIGVLEEQTQIAVDLAQSAIDETLAGNLQSQIDENKAAIDANEEAIASNSTLDDERYTELSGKLANVLNPTNLAVYPNTGSLTSYSIIARRLGKLTIVTGHVQPKTASTSAHLASISGGVPRERTQGVVSQYNGGSGTVYVVGNTDGSTKLMFDIPTAGAYYNFVLLYWVN